MKQIFVIQLFEIINFLIFENKFDLMFCIFDNLNLKLR